MKLSIVDLSVVQPGEGPSEALQHSLGLAELADCLGYEGIWFSEHHAKSIVWRSPEVLIAAAAAWTKRIRVGSGSVLLNHHSAYRVAEQLHWMKHDFFVDEFVIQDMTTDRDARHSYSLLAGLLQPARTARAPA